MISLSQSRTQPISKTAVWGAFKKVKSKGGSAGIDGVTIDDMAQRKHFKEALRLLEVLKCRLKTCKLEAHKEKTKIVYCKRNQKQHPPFRVLYRSFDFLGFTFKTRLARTKRGRFQLVFTPSMSRKAIKRVGEQLIEMRIKRMVHMTMRKIAEILNPKIRGWINYYKHFNVTGLKRAMRMVNLRLIKWVINKYRRFRRKPRKLAWNWLRDVYKQTPNMFPHWQHGFQP